MRIPSGKTDQYIYFVAVDSTDLKTRETGLSSFTVYRSRNGVAEVAYTTPTITEIDTTNMPGVYALLVDEDTTIAAGSDSEEYCVHITQASMAPVTRTIELYRRDTTSGQTATITSGGVTLADAVSHGGTLGSSTATMAMSRVNITSQTAATSALTLAGNTSGHGLTTTGGTTGDGLRATGGSTSGSGANITAGATTGNGLTITGTASGEGMKVTGGATGNGAEFTGGATSGNGIVAAATTEGDGIRATGVGTTRHGINAAGASAGNSAGILATGGNSGPGIYGIGGATGAGIRGDGGATSGAGLHGTSVSGDGATLTGGTNGHGIGATGAGSGDGMQLTAGGTGVDLDANITGDITGTLSTVTTATNVTTVNGLAANVITAASINADAITDAKVAADVTIASVTGAVGSVTGAVGSVTGNVGGNVTGSVGSVAAGGITAASIATGAIDADAIATDAVTELRSIVSGTADSGSTTTMVDAARTEADTDYWKDAAILFTSGTISGQIRLITAFDAATDTITFSPATTQAVGTNTYEILPNVAAAGASAPTAAEVADAVWDEDATGHQTQGTFGQAIGDPGADTDTIWALANTNLNATVSSRASQTSLDTVDDFLDTEIAAIKGKTDSLTFTTANRVDAQVFGMEANTVTASAIADNAIDAGAIAADAITAAKIADGAIDAATFAAGAINAAAIAADAIGASELAADAVTEIANAVWDMDATGHQTQGTFGQAIGDPVADTNTIYKAVVTDATGATVGVDVVAVKAETASIQSDTNDIQTRLPAALVSGRMDSSVGAMAANVLTAAATAADFTTEIQTGLATAAALDTVDNFLDTEIAALQADTDDIQARLPAALVGGRMDASVGAMAANTVTASAVATDAAAEIADKILGRSIQGGADGGRTVTSALRAMRNRRAIAAGTLTVYAEDDATPDHTAAVTTTAGNPISEVDPV